MEEVMTHQFKRLLVATALFGQAIAQVQIMPLGPEFQVNTFTPTSQLYPVVAAGPQGQFVVVWSGFASSESDISSYSIHGQRFASDGAPLGAEFQVNAYTTGTQFHQSVSIGPDGGFVVAWNSAGSSGNDTSGASVQMRRYASSGSPLGLEFQVNTYTTSHQFSPFVAIGPQKQFVIAWESDGSRGNDRDMGSIQARRFASDGTPLGREFQVNTYTTGLQSRTAVAMGAQGQFIVVWESGGSSDTDHSGLSIHGQRFESDGTWLGTEFQVNTLTTNAQYSPEIAVGLDGGFIVVWVSDVSAGTDSFLRRIQAQRFASTGLPTGPQFQVNTFTSYDQTNPAISIVPQGQFLIVWHSSGGPPGRIEADPYGVQGQYFASDGTALGAEFQANTFTTGFQANATVSFIGQEHFVVVWDGSDNIRGQRFAISTPRVGGSASGGALTLCGLLAIVVVAARRPRFSIRRRQ
jgi:hypothetical protein